MFENTRLAIKKIHILLLTLSQSLLVFLPLFRLLTSPPFGVMIRSLILSGTALFLMIFNLIIEAGDDKPTKKERKFIKTLRKHARTASNFACFIVLLFAWYTNDDPQLRIPLIFASTSVVFSLISYICRYVVTTVIDAMKVDMGQSLRKAGESIGQAGRKIGESVTQITERIKERHQERVEARASVAALSAPEGEEALPAPKKKKRLKELFQPKHHPELESLPAPEAEQLEEAPEEAPSEV